MAARRSQSGDASIYQLKITLFDTDPPIWRRLQVPGDTDLETLHELIQIAMGWENYHLWEFGTAERSFGPAEPDMEGGTEDAAQATLQEAVSGQGDRFGYLYDFGDGWEHLIEVEKIMAPEPGATYPVAIAGERACPPEDCGGVWGYQELLETLADPEQEDYEEMLEWVGEDFDPEAFDLEEVNEILKGYR